MYTVEGQADEIAKVAPGLELVGQRPTASGIRADAVLTEVEVSITVLSDWGLQQFPGVFVDDIEVSTGEGSTSFEDDADPTDRWIVTGAPQDAEGVEGANANDWVRRGGLGIKEGAAVATADSVYLGFGLEVSRASRPVTMSWTACSTIC